MTFHARSADGVPYAKLTSTPEPADLAAIEALSICLTGATGHLPRDWPTVPLCLPAAEERAEAGLGRWTRSTP
ncbi:hypothetical protein ABZ957_14910 [Streptomyces sp. NPDC046316]|uniref:hypothetical protein n=1 Tax=Streptomyces sp. NPDC046316 TaxID=3154494 RepID=UPI0033DF9555